MQGSEQGRHNTNWYTFVFSLADMEGITGILLLMCIISLTNGEHPFIISVIL